MIMKKLLNTNQTAEILNRKPDTLFRWRKRNFGPRWITVGRYVFYEEDAIDEWLESLRNGDPK
jgi:predicted DNA-binding transcriptional regulator AlpA